MNDQPVPWQLGPAADLGDEALAAAVVERFRAIHEESFAAEPFANHALGIELRALRRLEGWCVCLLLTPWMLARLFLPERQPELPLPAGWAAQSRAAAPYQVIGPALDVALLGGAQKAHLNYDATLGHYLVQPLVQSLEPYADADAVFAAWNDVIAHRQQVMESQQRECPWQRELSRREFFGRLAGRKA